MQDWKKCYIFAIEIKTYYKMNNTIYILQRERTEYNGNKVADYCEIIEKNYYESEDAADAGIEAIQKEWAKRNPLAKLDRRAVYFTDVILRWRIVPLYHA